MTGVQTCALPILLKLPDFAKQMLLDGKITEGQIRPLIGLDNKSLKKVLEKIVSENWPSRKIEQFIVDLKKSQTNLKTSSTRSVKQIYEKQLNYMIKKFKTEVSIRTNSRGAGQITIKFKNKNEFERIHNLISD